LSLTNIKPEPSKKYNNKKKEFKRKEFNEKLFDATDIPSLPGPLLLFQKLFGSISRRLHEARGHIFLSLFCPHLFVPTRRHMQLKHYNPTMQSALGILEQVLSRLKFCFHRTLKDQVERSHLLLLFTIAVTIADTAITAVVQNGNGVSIINPILPS